jgi:hypothetical protein
MKKILLSAVLTATVAVIANAQAPTNGLVAHYKFEGNLNDASGNNNHAQAATGYTPIYQISGLNGQENSEALYTDNNTIIFVDYSGKEADFQSQDFSYSIWAKVTGFNQYNNFIENGSSTGKSVSFRMYYNNGDVRVEGTYYNPDATEQLPVYLRSDPYYSSDFNDWHLFTFTSGMENGKRVSTIYLDTDLIKTDTLTTDTQIEYASYSKLNIASRDGSNNFSPNPGLFKHLYVYNRALTEAEVAQIYEADETLGINEAISNTKLVEVYPNPATTELNIVAKKQTSINVLNTIGAVVATQNIVEGNNTIDVSELVSGVYFIQTTDGSTIKFVVAK